ncbi:MAG: hypothetical protein U9N45_03845, partial [Gemmatimonadota bacterium]|nr:hypothetical protein [Gemmatimonadota bacterium]
RKSAGESAWDEGKETSEEPGPSEMCSVCGALKYDSEDELCMTCGSPLKGDSYEQSLLGEIERLSLYKYISSENYLQKKCPPDPMGEELLDIPTGWFGCSSPLLYFYDQEAKEAFTTRCRLVFTSNKLRFVFADGAKELDYSIIEEVSTEEELKKNGTPLLYYLVLTAATSTCRIMLPLKPLVAKELSETLERYLTRKVKALACLRNQRAG